MPSELTNSKRIGIFFVFTLAGCVLISFAISWWNGQLEYRSGLEAGTLLLPIIPTTFICGIASCFLMILISAWLAGLNKSFANIFIVCITFAFVTCAVTLFSPLIGPDAVTEFLHGFKQRVISSGVASNGVNWADSIFHDRHFNTNNWEEIHFSGKDVPAFFHSLFVGKESPESIIYYGEDKTLAERIEIRMSNGVDWGLLFVRNTNNLSGLQFDSKSLDCGNGLYVYVYYYK